MPPQDADGGSVPVSLQLVLALREAADLEAALGEPARAARYRERASAIVASVRRLAWHEGRGLFADSPARSQFSQQANILALLAGAAPPGQGKPLLDRLLAMPRPSIAARPLGRRAPPDVSRASVYFRFYLSRALEALGEGERYLPELEPWREMLDVGLSTFAEIPSVAMRSDCHAWSAHPNYDLLADGGGNQAWRRRASRPFASSPTSARSTTSRPRCPTRKGPITVSYRRDGAGARREDRAAPGPHGRVRLARRRAEARPGRAVLPCRVRHDRAALPRGFTTARVRRAACGSDASTMAARRWSLDRTAFYAESGGQPWDTGTLGDARSSR